MPPIHGATLESDSRKMSLETCGVLRYQSSYNPGRDDHGDKRYHKIRMGGVCVGVVSSQVRKNNSISKAVALGSVGLLSIFFRIEYVAKKFLERIFGKVLTRF